MATSGSNTTAWSSSNSKVNLRLSWSRKQTDIPNNRSLITLKLELVVNGYGIYFSAGKSGALHGQSFTYTGGFSGVGTKTLRTRDVWITHNSDGSKSQTFNANFDINIRFNETNTQLRNHSISVTANIDSIPRASSLTAFSFPNALQIGTATQINYTVDRKSSGFRHQVQLRDGSTVIQTWDNQNSDGSSNVQLSAASVDTLLSRMSNVTSRSLTLRVATRSSSGGGFIGSAVTRTATASIHTNVTPTLSSFSISQTGNNVTSAYLQNISKVTGSFTRAARGGATIATSSIVVRKVGNSDSQSISSNSGTTDRAVGSFGDYEAIAEVVDSRGRVAKETKPFTVTAYTPPKITTFTAVRNGTAATTINITRAGSFTALGGSNVLTILVRKRVAGGTWTNVQNTTVSTSPFTGTVDSTGNSVTASYEIDVKITDKFNNSVTAVSTVSTQKVVLDIYRDDGVGVGKTYEPNLGGVLQVGGDSNFSGNMNLNDMFLNKATPFSDLGFTATNKMPDTIEAWQALKHGVYYTNAFAIEGQPFRYGFLHHMTQRIGAGSDYNTVFYSQIEGTVYRKGGNGNALTDWIPIDRPESGSNSNGDWVRFNDGTQICWNGYLGTIMQTNTLYGEVYTSDSLTWDFPMSFSTTPTIIPSMRRTTGGAGWAAHSGGTSTSAVTALRILGTHSSTQGVLQPMAIGRWK